MEGYFLGKSLNIDEQITGISNVSIFVVGVVGISGSYRDSGFHSGKVVLLDKVSVYAGNVCTTINQCSGIDNFH